ncbi:MAG: FAD-dependent oxidoreductase [Lachnospiraceae bacterium]|nr:FAD-dependent oxidoreductase [Lachnospiraceae bacterium]
MGEMQKYIEKDWDLIIVGGGLTGVAAAAAARREGLLVLLVEKSGFLGGAPGTMLINPFMPYATAVDGKRFELSRGFFTELRSILKEIGGYQDGREDIHEEYVKLALDRLVKREGIQPLFHAVLCGVEKGGDTIRAVQVVTKAGVISLRGKYFIDATGDADLSVMAGCPYHLGRPDGLCQPMTLCFRIGNVDIPTFEKHRSEMQAKYKALQAEGKIKNPREDVLIFNTLVDGVLHFNTTRVVKHDPTNPFDVTEAEMTAREQMFEMYHFLRENCPGFEHAQLLYSAGEIGVRESRMIDGEYLLTETDLRDCVKFDDAVAAGNYDIDIHNPEGSGTSHYYFPAGTWYTIPYRSLQPRNVRNLLTAGRCISVTHEAQASIRIMPIVTTIGQAAGTAAALAVKAGKGVKEIDVKELQEKLKESGAFIG